LIPSLEKMKPKIYNILSEAIEEGITLGYRRAHKHVDNPSEQHILDSIHDSIMNQVCEYFDFE
jgi:hypothetical protein